MLLNVLGQCGVYWRVCKKEHTQDWLGGDGFDEVREPVREYAKMRDDECKCFFHRWGASAATFLAGAALCFINSSILPSARLSRLGSKRTSPLPMDIAKRMARPR